LKALDGHLGRWILQILSFGLSLGRSKKRFSPECLRLSCFYNIFELVSLNRALHFNTYPSSIHVKTVKIMKVICLFMQLDFAFHRGLEAVRIMVLEGFNKSATYINTSQASEMLNR
jgi:hypothetical protein